ncbi:hypothetical protein QL818_20020, partial [Bacillus altitudinis]|uniref:hypothetical protein n=1 Tax=Bacillus altitudinis TaxID=293387 RepID=UPI0024A99EE1
GLLVFKVQSRCCFVSLWGHGLVCNYGLLVVSGFQLPFLGLFVFLFIKFANMDAIYFLFF